MHYTDPKYNPLLEEVEEDYQRRVDQFVRDLAWGVRRRYWGPRLQPMTSSEMNVYDLDEQVPRSLNNDEKKREVAFYKPRYENNAPEELKQQFDTKWDLEIIPTKDDLWLWGYVPVGKNMLNQEAFALLDAPAIAPKVFISYRHIASSMLALAIEARLKYAGNNNIFIDKELSPGERFDTEITNAIKECEYFVILVDKHLFEPGSTGESWVKKEYELADGLGKIIIPILHPNVEKNDLKVLALEGFDTSIQYIDCKGISAFDYETAINRLLNRMGYATY